VKKILLLLLPSPLSWKLLPYAVCAARAGHHVRGDEHFCACFEQPLQDRAQEGWSEAAVHVVEVDVEVDRECFEIRGRGACIRNPLAYLRGGGCG
jgi:hypothetical protein